MNVKIKNISIPYGAIKRNKATKKMDNINNISIPYGAIKSFVTHILNLALLHFNSLWCD